MHNDRSDSGSGVRGTRTREFTVGGGGSESSLEDKRCLEFFQTHQVFSQGTPPTHTPIKPTADLKC